MTQAPLTVEMQVSMKKMMQQITRNLSKLERRLTSWEKSTLKANQRTAKSFNKVNAAIASTSSSFVGLRNVIISALSVREIQRFTDAWTSANNKLAASSEIAGRQARSLSRLNDLASETRSGLTATVDLYSKILRATKDVAKSELEVARATEIVSKAFKAGGAAVSEQHAAVLQLSQGMASGILAGDELRSIRENAPVLAQAIADEFGVGIGQLKALGAEGVLTTDRVFKAILEGEAKIEQAFSKTHATIADGFTILRNSLTEYIGLGDDSVEATKKIANALIALGDSLDYVILAGGIIAGRFIGPVMLGMLKKAATSVHTASAAMAGLGVTARMTGGSLFALRGALALLGGPFGLAIAALTAMPLLLTSTDTKLSEMDTLTRDAAEAMNTFAKASKKAAEEQKKLGGEISLATAEMLEQSRAAMEQSLFKAQVKLDEVTSDIFGKGWLDGSEVSRVIGQLEEARGTTDGGLIGADLSEAKRAELGISRKSPFLTGLISELEALEEGDKKFEEVHKTILKVSSVGETATGVIDSFNKSLDRTGEGWTDQWIIEGRENLVKFAKETGAFEKELAAIKVAGPKDVGQAYLDLRNSIEDAHIAQQILFKDETFLEMLKGAALTEKEIAEIKERLADVANGLIKVDDESTAFDKLAAGAYDAAAAVGSVSEAIKTLRAAIPELAKEDKVEEKLKNLGAVRQAALAKLPPAHLRSPENHKAAQEINDLYASAVAEVNGTSARIESTDKSLADYLKSSELAALDAKERAIKEEMEKFEKLYADLDNTGASDDDKLKAQAAHKTNLLQIENDYKKAVDEVAVSELNLADVRDAMIASGNKELYIEQEKIRLKKEHAELLPLLAAQLGNEAKAQEILNQRYADMVKELESIGEKSENIAEQFARAALDEVRAADSVTDAIERLAKRLQRLAEDRVFDDIAAHFNSWANSQKSGTPLGDLFGFLFSGGGTQAKGSVRHEASGGLITGPGTATSDSIPAMLSNGEYVINAASTRMNLPLLEAINRGPRIPKFASGGMVGGGGGARAGFGMKVEINNHSSSEVEARQLPGGQGVEVIITDVVKNGLMSGKFNGPMRQNFGITPKTQGG